MIQTLRFLAEGDMSGANSALGSRIWRREQIVSFNAVPRSDSVVEVSILYRRELPYRILDTSPVAGSTVVDIEAPSQVWMISSSPFDEDILGLASGLFTFNQVDIGAGMLSLFDDNFTLKVDLSSMSPTDLGTKTVIATDLLKDVEGKSLENGFNLSWQVEKFTSIQSGLRQPPTASTLSGVLRVARVVVDLDSSSSEMFDRWTKSKGLQESSVVGQVEIPGPSSSKRIYILYFDRLAPTVTRIFPNSGAVLSQETKPDRIVMGLSQPLDPIVLTDPGRILLDGSAVPLLSITLSPDGYVLEIEDTGLGVGEHILRIPRLLGVNGTASAVPMVSTFFSSAKIGTGGLDPGETGTDHGTLTGLTDDDHNHYHTDARGDARYYTKTQLNAGQLDTRYYTETELNAGQLDTRYYTETEVNTNFQAISEKGAASGYSSLDASSFVVEKVQFMRSGTLAARPGTAIIGQMYAATDGLLGNPAVFVWINPP